MNRRTFLQLAGLSLTSCFAAQKQPVQENTTTKLPKKSSQKNVLLIVTDDQSAHLACLGTPGIATPHADRLAREGVLFRNAFAACTSCSPARSAILTGMYPHANGHWRNTHTPTVPGKDADYGRTSRFRRIEHVGVHEDVPTLVEILNARGYVTGITEKFHLSPVWKYPFQKRLGAGPQPATHRKAMGEFLAHCGGRPFFLMANIGNTHRPFKPHIVPIDQLPVSPERIAVPGDLPDTPLMRSDLAEYFNTVQCADACAGALLDGMKSAGRFKDTLVIFTSDQGYCYHRAKATAYDAGLRVPLIVSGPGVTRESTREDLVSHVDLMPTILSWLGLPVPGNVQGRNLRPLLSGGERAGWRRLVFAEHNAHGPNPHEFYPIRSVFDGRFHYLRNLRHDKAWTGEPDTLLGRKRFPAELGFAGPQDAFQQFRWGNRSFEATCRARAEFPRQYQLLKDVFNRPAEELYDLQADPFEMDNLAGEARFEDTLRRLRSAVDDWMRATGDPGLKMNVTQRRIKDPMGSL